MSPLSSVFSESPSPPRLPSWDRCPDQTPRRLVLWQDAPLSSPSKSSSTSVVSTDSSPPSARLGCAVLSLQQPPQPGGAQHLPHTHLSFGFPSVYGLVVPQVALALPPDLSVPSLILLAAESVPWPPLWPSPSSDPRSQPPAHPRWPQAGPAPPTPPTSETPLPQPHLTQFCASALPK